jgi:two-component system sensor histidine kinase YesM
VILIGTKRFQDLENIRIVTAVEDVLRENAAHTVQCIELFMRVESAIIGNRGMADLFLFTDKSDTASVVFQVRDLSDELEQLQFPSPSPQFSARIFVDDSDIPERWPVFYHQDRLQRLPPPPDAGAGYGRRWQYGYPGEIPQKGEPGTPMAAYTTEILLWKRRIGDLQILMPMRDFFPCLYRGAGSYFVFSPGLLLEATPGRETLPRAIQEQLLKAAGEKESGALTVRDNRKSRYFLWQRSGDLLFVRDYSGELADSGVSFLRTAAALGVVLSSILLFLLIRFVTRSMMGRVLATETELRTMQNQINSHFLYNALETIKMQAELRNVTSIVESITLLGRMLRYCLRSMPNPVALGEELEYIRSYIGFLNIRNDYHITLKETIDPCCMDHQIPKMLIQPLVENAFHHAIEPEGEDAVIELRAEKRDTGILWITIRDYGPGIRETELKALAGGRGDKEKERGIGIKNIQLRLSAFYGPQWKLRIENAKGGGTLVGIPIPAIPTAVYWGRP